MWKRPFVIVSCSCQKVLVSTSSSNNLLECSGWLEEFLVATNQECCRRRHAGRWLPFSNASLVNVSTLSWAIPNWLTTASSSNNLFPLNDKQNVLQIYFLYIEWHHQSPAKYPHCIYLYQLTLCCGWMRPNCIWINLLISRIDDACFTTISI